MNGSRVLARSTHAAALGCSNSDGHLGLPAEHVAHLRHLVDDLFACDAKEIGEHHLNDGSAPRCRGPDAGTDEAGLADRRVADPLFAELVHQTGGYLEDAAELSNVFAHNEHVLVVFQLFTKKRGRIASRTVIVSVPPVSISVSDPVSVLIGDHLASLRRLHADC